MAAVARSAEVWEGRHLLRRQPAVDQAFVSACALAASARRIEPRTVTKKRATELPCCGVLAPSALSRAVLGTRCAPKRSQKRC
jgi:hypothetical protein